MNLSSSMAALECFIILEGMERERKSMSFMQQWKTRKEYKRKRQRVLSMIEEQK